MSRYLGILTSIALLVVICFAIVKFSPTIENKFFPVIDNDSLLVRDVSTQDDGSVLFRFEFLKSRACTATQVTWYFLDDFGVSNVANIVKADKVISMARPVGKNLSIFWKLEKGQPFPGEYYIYVIYNCGFLWETNQIIGPFHIKG